MIIAVILFYMLPASLLATFYFSGYLLVPSRRTTWSTMKEVGESSFIGLMWGPLACAVFASLLMDAISRKS